VDGNAELSVVSCSIKEVSRCDGDLVSRPNKVLVLEGDRSIVDLTSVGDQRVATD